MPLEVGSVVEGKVKSIAPFGAFVALPEGQTGLVHISEVAMGYVQDIKQFLSEGDAVKIKVVSIDQSGRINLSIKKVIEDDMRAGRISNRRPADIDWSRQSPSQSMSFEDMLNSFKKESEEKIQHLKVGKDTRRSKGNKKPAEML